MEIDDPMNGNQEFTINKVIIKSPRAIKRIYFLYITSYTYICIFLSQSLFLECLKNTIVNLMMINCFILQVLL